MEDTKPFPEPEIGFIGLTPLLITLYFLPEIDFLCFGPNFLIFVPKIKC